MTTPVNNPPRASRRRERPKFQTRTEEAPKTSLPTTNENPKDTTKKDENKQLSQKLNPPQTTESLSDVLRKLDSQMIVDDQISKQVEFGMIPYTLNQEQNSQLARVDKEVETLNKLIIENDKKQKEQEEEARRKLEEQEMKPIKIIESDQTVKIPVKKEEIKLQPQDLIHERIFILYKYPGVSYPVSRQSLTEIDLQNQDIVFAINILIPFPFFENSKFEKLGLTEEQAKAMFQKLFVVHDSAIEYLDTNRKLSNIENVVLGNLNIDNDKSVFENKIKELIENISFVDIFKKNDCFEKYYIRKEYILTHCYFCVSLRTKLTGGTFRNSNEYTLIDQINFNKEQPRNVSKGFAYANSLNLNELFYRKYIQQNYKK